MKSAPEIVMRPICAIASIVAAVSVGACVQARDSADLQAERLSAVRPERADGAVSAPTVREEPVETRDPCALLTPAEVTEITGVPIERTERKSDSCEWYANAAAQQQKSADSVRATLGTLAKPEPKSASDGVLDMENLLKGIGGAIAPTKPLFAATVHWDGGDTAEGMLKGTIAFSAAGQPGGGLEPVEGLGDRAFIGAMGTLFYVRKGPTLVLFGAMGITRQQEIALARKFLSKM